MSHASDPIVRIEALGFPWKTVDPFLFCAYHDDAYPRGNAAMGPDAPLAGRDLGQDFSRKDGWSMYHGTTVPGFPGHPHRGFETVTIVRRGLIDHSDSLGAAARFGQGQRVEGPAAIELRADAAVELANGDATGEYLVLQGRPIGEPVAQYGPFVMNTQAEIAQAMSDYRRTQFGGWPWEDTAPVHGHDPARFARHADGREERPEPSAPSVHG